MFYLNSFQNVLFQTRKIINLFDSNCCFTEYNKHPGYYWCDSRMVRGEENSDYYVVSDWSDSGLFYREEQDYMEIQKEVQKTGRYCYVEKHNWEDKDSNGNLYCWWFVRLKSDEVMKVDVYSH